MMDARKQATVAPLLVVDAWKKPPLEDRAFAFQRAQRGGRPRLKSERRRQRRLRDGSEALQPSAQDLDHRLLARPRLASLVRRRGDVRFEPSLRPQSPELIQSLGRNPQRRSLRLQESDAPLARQRVEPFAPSGNGVGFLFAEAGKPQQRVMEFLGV